MGNLMRAVDELERRRKKEQKVASKYPPAAEEPEDYIVADEGLHEDELVGMSTLPMSHSHGAPVDMVNHPPHYTSHPSGIECIQITEHMNFCLGNATKYIWRADLKGSGVEDLKKAIWYIQREIARRESK